MSAGKKTPTTKKGEKKEISKKGGAGDLKDKKQAEETRQKSDARPQVQAESTEPAKDQMPFPIVGIGASAGGLEALEAFFENLPVESGIAFVVVTHTDPKRASLLKSIIKRKTKVSVKQVEEAMAVEPNTVYLPPSDRDLFLEHQLFHLKNRPTREEMHMPVDLFLRHMAEEWREQAACVILSGTGTDGTFGLRTVKEKAGGDFAE